MRPWGRYIHRPWCALSRRTRDMTCTWHCSSSSRSLVLIIIINFWSQHCRGCCSKCSNRFATRYHRNPDVVSARVHVINNIDESFDNNYLIPSATIPPTNQLICGWATKYNLDPPQLYFAYHLSTTMSSKRCWCWLYWRNALIPNLLILSTSRVSSVSHATHNPYTETDWMNYMSMVTNANY